MFLHDYLLAFEISTVRTLKICLISSILMYSCYVIKLNLFELN